MRGSGLGCALEGDELWPNFGTEAPAEREGFEPPEAQTSAAFKAAAFVHSATVPVPRLPGYTPGLPGEVPERPNGAPC
jgi:hypothetical protein